MTISGIIASSLCTGCSLCASVCPKQCISMSSDIEGFPVPVIDTIKCIDCGICYKKCPSGSTCVEKYPPQKYMAAILDDKHDLHNSSSGGVFIALAKYVLAKNGYVCGCIFDENIIAQHICTDDWNTIKMMMGSKYVQSDMSRCLLDVKNLIQQGKLVLFTGTACQIAALKSFIGHPVNLILVDILCHGVPSPLFLEKYKIFLQNKHKGKVTKLEFRNKKKLGWGSEHRTYYEISKDGKVKGYYPSLPGYFCAFFWGINLRHSCYACSYSGENRVSDLTIGDFWGYWRYYKKRFPEGISIISVNTNKGVLLYDELAAMMKLSEEVDASSAKASNTNFFHPTVKPITRDQFYRDIQIKEYKNFRLRIFGDKTCRKKLLTSLYGRYCPDFLRKFIRNVILK